MNKRPTPVAWVYCFFVFILVSCASEQTPEVFEKHLADNPDIRKKYIYQSVIRLANINHTAEFDKLIRDVRKIVVYLPPSEDSTYQIKTLKSDIRSNGYEELIDVRTADKENISLWINETFSKPHFIGLLDTTGDDYIFEIDGQLNLEYATSLNLINQGTLRGLLD